MALWPLTFEILITFILSAGLLYRYGNWVTQNILTTFTVFISWYFSFIVIFILPLDISTTSYLQCQLNYNNSHGNHSHEIPFDVVKPYVNISNVTTVTPYINVTTAIPLINVTTTISPPDDPSSHKSLDETCHKPWSYVPGNVLSTLWRIVYWSSQILTWLLLPMIQSYSMAGDFTIWRKIKSAFIENIIFYGSFGVIFVFLFMYVALHHTISMEYLKVICITASNTWGLLLLILLLGYGLVEIPKSCFDTSRHARTLNYLYFKVSKLSAEKCEAEEKLEDSLEEILAAYDTIMSSPSIAFNKLKPLMAVILEKCPEDWTQQLLIRYAPGSSESENTRVTTNRSASGGIGYTEATLVKLHQNILRATQSYHRTQVQYDHLIRKVIGWEDVAKNHSNPSRIFKRTLPKVQPSPGSSRNALNNIIEVIITPKVEWFWKCRIRSPFYKVLGVILTGLTFIVLWSEMTFSITSPTLSIFALMLEYAAVSSGSYFFIEVISIICISYLCVCAYYTVFKIRVFNFYYLAPHHQTDESSLVFCGMILSRLTPPLCLNFLGLVHLDSHITKSNDRLETSFTKIMGHMDVIPFISEGFNVYLPIIMCFLCLMTFLDVGSRLLHFMGIEQFMIDDELTSDLIKEGIELVKREKNKKMKLDNSGSRSRSFGTRNKSSVSGNPNVNSGGSYGTTGGGSAGVRQAQHQQLPSASDLTRSSSGDSRIELLNDVESPVDYNSTQWIQDNSTRSIDVNRASQPNRNIFDDV